MLDELGNLQSEGHGIDSLQTMLSIGLGQDQQFTLILQTLQQLRDVYGESADKIIQGNANWINAKLATPNGWKRMGDIQVGDEVYTPDGTITRVAGVYPKGVRPVYKVTLRDGSSTLVCNQHLWEIERWKSAIQYTGTVDERGHREYIGIGEDGKTMKMVSEVIDTDELKRRVDAGKQIYLPIVKPIAYPEKNLLIDSYLMGVILGDGNIDKMGRVTLSCDDEDIIHELETRGYKLTFSDDKPDKCPVYYINDVCDKLRILGLAGHRAWEKFIPEDYLFGSVSQRIDLLRGLMDTDGTISNESEMEFTSSSEVLANQVQSLIRSLGGRVSVNVKDKVFYTSPNQKSKKQARPAYRVQNIRLPEINPFLLKRKSDRWHDRDNNSSGNYGNRVVSVEYVFDDEVQCILVEDSRHLFIVDDYIPTHNTSNIVFLKSTDDAMLDTLQKMSGTTHKVYKDSKTVTRDMERIWMQNEGKVSYTMNVREVPVITYNDMAFINERNSILFRAGDSPIWNRNETILPMAWRLLHTNPIKQPGKEYDLKTVPSLSTVIDFDVRKNQPDFIKMLDKRMSQAYEAEISMANYKKAYGYSDYEIEQLDPDVYADEILDMINMYLRSKNDVFEGEEEDFDYMDVDESMLDIEENEEVTQAVAEQMQKQAERDRGIYANGLIAKSDLVVGPNAIHQFDKIIVETYLDIRGAMEQDSGFFTVDVNGSLCGLDGTKYIIRQDDSGTLKKFNDAAKDKDSRVFSEDEISDIKHMGSFIVTDAFIKFLASLNKWDFANGEFERGMANRVLYNYEV